MSGLEPSLHPPVSMPDPGQSPRDPGLSYCMEQPGSCASSMLFTSGLYIPGISQIMLGLASGIARISNGLLEV